MAKHGCVLRHTFIFVEITSPSSTTFCSSLSAKIATSDPDRVTTLSPPPTSNTGNEQKVKTERDANNDNIDSSAHKDIDNVVRRRNSSSVKSTTSSNISIVSGTRGRASEELINPRAAYKNVDSLQKGNRFLRTR